MWEDQGLANVEFFDPQKVGSKDAFQAANFKLMTADFVLFLNRPNDFVKHRVRDITFLSPATTAPYGDLKRPPSIIWSIDDNYHWVHPLNPSFQYNGYQLLDGTILKNDDVVAIQTSDGGREVVWKAGVRYNNEVFRPEDNRKGIKEMDDLIKDHALQVAFSSPRLEQFYREEIGYPSTTFFPNCINLPDYFGLLDSAFTRNTKHVRVLWQGGASHFQDLYPLKEPLKRCLGRNRNLQLIVWGQLYTWITREIPDDQFVFIPWVAYDAYKPLLCMMDYDFAIAPLVDNPFNQGKSCIKVYESAATPHPKPTLAARVPPYSDEFEDGVTAVLYDPRDPKEFEDKFERLAGDPEWRKRIGENCREWIREHRDAATWSKTWFEQLMELRGKGTEPNPGLADLIEVARR